MLVVDDEVDLRALVTLALQFEDGLQVIGTAGTADEACDRAQEMRPDLIVLDHLLGGPVTGLQVADRLTRDLPLIRVILFSASDDIVDLREHRVDAVVSKMDIATLPDVVRRVLHAGA